jgi:hypothetical protein
VIIQIIAQKSNPNSNPGDNSDNSPNSNPGDNSNNSPNSNPGDNSNNSPNSNQDNNNIKFIIQLSIMKISTFILLLLVIQLGGGFISIPKCYTLCNCTSAACFMSGIFIEPPRNDNNVSPTAISCLTCQAVCIIACASSKIEK